MLRVILIAVAVFCCTLTADARPSRSHKQCCKQQCCAKQCCKQQCTCTDCTCENCPADCLGSVKQKSDVELVAARGRAKRFWPFTPYKPIPKPTPKPEPLPEPIPTPRPENSVVPAEREAANTYIASKLGGYSRANHVTKSGFKVDMYQARGKQRVVWQVGDVGNSIDTLVKALIAKTITEVDQAGIVLIGTELPPVITAAVKGAGAWLVVVNPTTGELQYVVYPKPAGN